MVIVTSLTWNNHVIFNGFMTTYCITPGDVLTTALLGYRWKPFSELKSTSDSDQVLEWNNNQIYTTLLELHRRVTARDHWTENLPAKKLKTITDKGSSCRGVQMTRNSEFKRVPRASPGQISYPKMSSPACLTLTRLNWSHVLPWKRNSAQLLKQSAPQRGDYLEKWWKYPRSYYKRELGGLSIWEINFRH